MKPPHAEALAEIGVLDDLLVAQAFDVGHSGFDRLEHLGDAVLDLAVARAVHAARLPAAVAMELTSDRNLMAVFDRLGLASMATRRTGDVVEAVIGAVHLVGGFEAAARVAVRWCVVTEALGAAPPAEPLPDAEARSLRFVGACVLDATVSHLLAVDRPTLGAAWLHTERVRLVGDERLYASARRLAIVGNLPPGPECLDAIQVHLSTVFLNLGWQRVLAVTKRLIGAGWRGGR